MERTTEGPSFHGTKVARATATPRALETLGEMQKEGEIRSGLRARKPNGPSKLMDSDCYRWQQRPNLPGTRADLTAQKNNLSFSGAAIQPPTTPRKGAIGFDVGTES